MEGTTPRTPAQSRKARIRLTPRQRSDLLGITRGGSTKAKRFLHARVLLLADEAQAGGGLTDQRISLSLGIAVKTVSRIRRAFLKGGITVAVERKKRATPPIEPVIDGKAEATLAAVCCSPPPSGRARWSLRLLADELVKRKIVAGVCKETVRKTLKKTGRSPGVRSVTAFGERDAARFVSRMEEAPDVYCAKPDPDRPLAVMDEAAEQLPGDAVEPLPMTPGTPKREDYHYARGGVRPPFLFFAPHPGWRRVESGVRRTRVDWAHQIKKRVDEDFPRATKITPVCDNLDTHTNASLYETFPPEEAHRPARKLETHYTPRGGSRLNVAEIESSILAGQCPNRRIKDPGALDTELAAWALQRNEQKCGVKWQFTTADARVKLRRLYPTV